MKNNFVLKLFSIFSMLIGIQLAYADSLSFTFKYGDPQVGSVFFDHTTDESHETAANNGNFSVSTNSKDSSYVVTISTPIKKGGSSRVASDFNNHLYNDPFHMIQLTSTVTGLASDFDFWERGKLYIGDELASSDFTLAHDSLSNNWWIGALDGSRYTPTAAISLHTMGGKYYCLNQDANNYEVVVKSGSCDPINYNGAVDIAMDFKYSPAEGVKYVQFTYDGNNDDMHDNYDYLENVYYDPQPNWNKYWVHVVSNTVASTEIASSFNNNLGSASKMMKLKSGKVQSKPVELDYWIEGDLQITDNQNNVATFKNVTLALDPDGQTWWIGSNDATSSDNEVLHLGNYCLYSGGIDKVKVKPQSRKTNEC